MSKIIAVQSRMDDVARALKQRGYTVIDMMEASGSQYNVDAFLYTSYHSDIVSSFNSFTQADDAVVADSGDFQPSSATLVMVNVTGMSPDHAVDVMEERLQYKEGSM